jgi:hypothetical protein
MRISSIVSSDIHIIWDVLRYFGAKYVNDGLDVLSGGLRTRSYDERCDVGWL